MNIYDLIEFPNKTAREQIRSLYPVFSFYKQISPNALDKYKGLVPIEFEDYDMTVTTWVNEYNHLWFIMLIPLYQAIDSYQKMTELNSSEELYQYLRYLFYFYSEISAYYIDCAFEKSAYIFNAMFELRVNEHQSSLKEIYKKIKEKAEKGIIIKDVKAKLESIKTNKYYCDITNIRNKNTHSIKVSHRNLYEVFNHKTGITKTYVSKVIMPEELMKIIFGSIELLSDYTDFIEKTIEKYYASIYEEFCLNSES
jgi:hypothetical protein